MKRKEKTGLHLALVTHGIHRALFLAKLPPPPAPDPHRTHGGEQGVDQHTLLEGPKDDLLGILLLDQFQEYRHAHQDDLQGALLNQLRELKRYMVRDHLPVVVFIKGHILAAIQDHLPVVVALHTPEATLHILVHHQAHLRHHLQVLHPVHLDPEENDHIHLHPEDLSLILDPQEGQG